MYGVCRRRLGKEEEVEEGEEEIEVEVSLAG